MDFKVITKKYRALKLVLTLVLACAFILLIGGMSDFGKVKATAQTVAIRTASDLTAYSNAYKNGTSYTGSDSITITPAADDIIVISITSGTVVSNNSYVSIGTAGRPFSGTLVIPTSGLDFFDLYNKPLFDYVSTDFSIESAGGGEGTLKIKRHGSTGNKPLFATHVTKGTTTNNAHWTIILTADSDGSTCAGLIGDIADECVVAVDFTSNKAINVSYNTNVGYICGTLGERATLNVTTGGSAAGITISSSGGHAGGLVGEMKDGSKLTINSLNTGRFTSVSTSNSDKYAGGVVGSVDNVTATTNGVFVGTTNYLVDCTVTGKKGAGAIAGYYKNSAASATFTMENTFRIASNLSITSDTSTGGVFGLLENTGASFTFDGDKTNKTIYVNLTKGTARGGVCGAYLTNSLANSLANTFTITDTSTRITANAGSDKNGGAPNFDAGGLVGLVKTNAAYISISDVQCVSEGTSDGNCPGGGLVGSIAETGSFIDVSGSVSVTGKFYAGLIEYMGEGVLRIQGTTDLTGLSRHNLGTDYTTGTIVRRRNRALIYALGNGSDYDDQNETGWTLKRYTGYLKNTEIAGNNIDDIVSWGQVIRIYGSPFNEEDVVDVNMTAHTVTLLGATATISDVNEFAITALNIKLNTGADAVGALQFTAGEANTSSYLLSHTITLSGDIDLTNTGITGLTRDNDFKIGNTTYSTGSFTGTLNGGGHTITLATGEVYGVRVVSVNSSETTTPLSYLNGSGKLDSIEGTIRRHLLNGLFARTSGAVIQNLTVAGSLYITDDQKGKNMGIGGIVAEASGTLTLTNNTVTGLTVNVVVNGGNAAWGNSQYTPVFIGGAVGIVKGNNATVTVSGGTYRPTVTDRSYQSQGFQFVGGVIGFIDSGSTQNVSIGSCSIGLVYTKAIRDTTEEPGCPYLSDKVHNKSRESCFGAAIGGTLNQAYEVGKRIITLNTVSVDIVASGIAANNRFGAILGTDWLSADVTLTGITVTNASLTVLTTGGAVLGGLVHTATGHWVVNSVALTNGHANFSFPTNSYFGFIANKTYSTANGIGAGTALFLELDNTGSNYDIAALAFTNQNPNKLFDEVVAYSKASASDVIGNGNSVISIKTSGDVISTTNTYLNKTAYGKADNRNNANTRYYYNIGDAITNTATPKYNFLVWTVKQYAHSSIQSLFGDPENTFTGDLDMTGLSYYPIDLTSSVTFSSATLKLDNITMESRVKYGYDNSGTLTGTYHSTRNNKSQHYLMHTSAFRNVTADITITELTIQGNVPKISNDICGFIVAGTLGGTSNEPPTITTLTASSLVFDGAYISNGNNYYGRSSTTYAPLFINKIGKNTTLTINSASQSTSAYSSFHDNNRSAASSLIGNVGSEDATAINLSFSHLVFDGRSTAGSTSDAFYTAYGTKRSIFSCASILNSFACADHNEGSTGIYNFGLDEDWTASGTPLQPTNPSSALHNVTYGQEITNSVEFDGKQLKYYSSKYYTRYSATPTTSIGDADDFSSGFLKYVYTTGGTNQHELMVNTSYDYEITGCGKYDDPYIIDSYEMLDYISKLLNRNTTITNTSTICLPSDITSYNYTTVKTDSTPGAGQYKKYEYSFGTTNFTSTDGGTDRAYDVVREYLAGAYYEITVDELEIQMGFIPLGTPSTNDAAADKIKFAFRGVIIGNDCEITNPTNSPLIRSSNGCVVKDLTIKVGEFNDANHDKLELAFQSSYLSFEYDAASSHTAYGAVIGQIMGGDTIIDNVDVQFDEDVKMVFPDAGTTDRHLIPIGGYVGVVVNGGLVFRNMTASNEGLTDDVAFCYKETVHNDETGSDDTQTTEISDAISNTGYIYINPIIGRVIAGYAFNETASTYNATSAYIPNGNKNYTIPDMSLAATKLGISNTYDVTVPNGQALYVLGAIVNSGAASASDYNAQYNALSDNWSAYRQYTTVRGGADYSDVGTSTSYGTDYTSACKDSYASTTPLEQIPYIIRAYTTPVDSVKYYARSLASSGSVSISITGSCTGGNAVAAGFRGIGSIYLDNNLVRLRISSFNGDGNTVTLNMRYIEYDPSSEYYKAANQNTAGFGLFNILQIYRADSSNAVYDMTLSGSVFYDIINHTTGSSSLYRFKNDDDNGIGYASVLNVGGIAGYVGKDVDYDKYYLKNITLNGLSVEGAKYAGGLIGYSGESTAMSTIANCGTGASNTGITVKAGGAAGGFIGYLRSYVTINGDIGSSGTKSTLLVNQIETKGQNTTDTGFNNNNNANNLSTQYLYNTMFYSAGGIIGLVQPQSTTVSTIQNYIIKGKSGNLKHIYSTSTSEGQNTNAGGVVGTIKNQRLTISDVDVQDVKISAAHAGGVIGRSFSNKAIGDADEHIINISDISIDGDTGSSGTNSSITGYLSAGGIIADMDKIGDNGGGTIVFENGEIKNYDISSSTGSNANHAVGGFMGYSNPGSNAALTVKIHNFIVDGCAISNLATGTNENNGTGSLFGVVRRSNLEGYNILVNDTSVTSATADPRTSAVIGNYFKSNSTIKLVGVSVNLTGLTTENTKARATGKSSGDVDALEDYNENDYIVFADYKNVSSGISPNTAFAGIGNGYTNVTSASPYVTANPKITLGTTNITSDGVADIVANLPYTQIKTDGVSGKYKYSASSYLSTFDSYDGFLHLFSSEALNYSGTDFPVLVLEDETRSVSHEMINSYLRLLTNTKIDFGSSDDTRFNVVIYKMTYDSNTGSFSASTSGVSLKRADGQFYMENTDVDSGKTIQQFSLIDVQFKDPSSSEIAYHLYVPVFVKKAMLYQFDIAIRSGTTYIENNYSSSYGRALIENVGTPVTIYFKYTYSRNADDWTAAVITGENVNQNYTKTLTFTKANENVVVKDYPNDTILVLVDKQTGTPYYATWGMAFSSGTLNLSAFRSVMTKSAGVVTFSGAYFSPAALGSLLTVSENIDGQFVRCDANHANLKFIASDGYGYRLATVGDGALTKYSIIPNMIEDDDGIYVSCSAGEATLAVGSDYYREATSGELADDSIVKYSDKLTESYYISIFTDVSDNFHYYIVSTPSSLTGSGTMTNIEDQEANTMCHLIMGKIFDHENFEISSSSYNSDTGDPGGQLMTDSNNGLKIYVSAQMGLSDSLGALKNEVATAVGGTNVYQSFLVYLNRKENSEQLRAILGNPDTSGSWGIDADLSDAIPAVEDRAYGAGDMRSTQNYAEFVTTDLSAQFATKNRFCISATLSLEYSAAAIPAQFPGEYEDNGVTVSGSSNISFLHGSTASSKNTVTGSESPLSPKIYYSAARPEVAVLDLIPIDGAGNFDFSNLGINAHYLDGPNINTQVYNGVTYAVSADFDLLADLNTEQVRDQIESYTSAVITITLAKKGNDGTYGEDLDVSDYITMMKIGETSATDDGDSFSTTIQRANLTDDGSTITLPILHFRVKTGKALEDDDLTYGNYRITVAVTLHNGASPLSVSNASNYVVYTNSKVISEYIMPPQNP